jgi:AAA family ATP:ADP antiporter
MSAPTIASDLSIDAMVLVERFLHLGPGDLRRGLPFFGYYFLIISSYLMGQVARDALFLDQFKAVQLPYADIAVAALVSLVVALYIRVARHANLRDLLVGSLCSYALSVLLLWWGLHYHRRPWLYPVLYVWVGIFGVLATAQVWTLANFVWTTREAKRLFGLLGSGGIAGGIFGGFFSNSLAHTFGTESLLAAMVFFLIAAAALVQVIWSQSRAGESPRVTVVSEGGPRNLRESFGLVLRSRHLQAIAALICLSSVVTTAAGWQFKAIAKETLVQKDALAAFFGAFYGCTGIGSLFTQLFLTTKLLRRFGVGMALLILPISLFAGSMGVLFWGTLWAASLLKGSDKVLRYSVDTSALQLLYLPIPAPVKVQVKSFTDTVIWRFGDGLAGLTLLVFATHLQFSPRQISLVNMALLGLWLLAAVIARRRYVATLGKSMRHFARDQLVAPRPIIDRATTRSLAVQLASTDPDEVLSALSLFETGQQQHADSAIRGLLDHPTAAVRTRAIAVLGAAGDTSVRERIVEMLHDDDLEVRTEALHYLSRHDHIDALASVRELNRFSDFSIRSATVAFLAKPGEAQNVEAARWLFDAMVKEQGAGGAHTRLAAARIITALPDCFESQLAMLLADSDAEVVRQAIRAVGALRKRRFVPALVERLADPRVSQDAGAVLAGFENAVVGTLADCLSNSHLSLALRREIPRVLLRIGTAPAARVLAENLLQVDDVLRDRVISSLNKLQERHPTPFVDRNLVETVLVAEIMDHYRSYQILGARRGHADEMLQASMTRELERIFRLMKLLFPSIDLQNAYREIQSKDAVGHANVLEFLDNTLNSQLRSLVIPMIDPEISPRERTALADKLLGSRVNSYHEAIAILLHSEDPWLRTCAEYAIEKLGPATPGFRAAHAQWSTT